MSNIAVLYRSKYGTTKRYAEWIAQELNATLLDAASVKPAKLASFAVVVFGSSLCASGINGVELITKNPCERLVVFTVGLANPDHTDYTAILAKNFSPEQLAAIKVFHLRGGIDYQKLSVLHKGMMSMRKNMLLKKDEAELSSDDRALLETYGQQVDFTDRESIQPLVAFVKEIAAS